MKFPFRRVVGGMHELKITELEARLITAQDAIAMKNKLIGWLITELEEKANLLDMHMHLGQGSMELERAMDAYDRVHVIDLMRHHAPIIYRVPPKKETHG